MVDEKPYNTPDTLRELYIDQELIQDEIADPLDTSSFTISRRLRKFNIF